GITDRERWSEYPWLRAGGLLLRPVRDPESGRWYYAAGRIAPRLENPDGGRFYVETRHAVAAVDQVRFRDLFALSAALRAEPLTAADWGMPPLAVERAAPLPLERGWFAQVRPLLEAVASGERAAGDARLDPDRFFELALKCLACLPGTVRWRVPVAAG